MTLSSQGTRRSILDWASLFVRVHGPTSGTVRHDVEGVFPLGVWLIVTLALAGSVRADEDIVVQSLNSEHQSGPTEIRVLLPKRLEAARRRPILFVLPVEANRESRYGDGLEEIRRGNFHNRFDLICVAPTFARLPWYADHPTDPKIHQETYFVQDVLQWVDRHYPTDQEPRRRWLLGFSKSGYGAWSLLARHPQLFERAAIWDAPLDMPRYDQYGAGAIFGTQAHFETYRVLPALARCKDLRNSPPRLILTGYDNFRTHHQAAQAFLKELQIPVIVRDGPRRPHVWGGGWVEESVELLVNPPPASD